MAGGCGVHVLGFLWRWRDVWAFPATWGCHGYTAVGNLQSGSHVFRFRESTSAVDDTLSAVSLLLRLITAEDAAWDLIGVHYAVRRRRCRLGCKGNQRHHSGVQLRLGFIARNLFGAETIVTTR